MNVHQWTPVTRDWVKVEDVMVDGQPVALADLDLALLTPRTKPDADTTWIDATAHPDDGTPAILIAGYDADPAGATVLAADAELWGRVTKSGTTVAARLARFTY